MSIERFAPAEAAIRAGDLDEGIRLTAEELSRDPGAPLRVYKNFVSLLIRHQRYSDAETWSRIATSQYPRDYDLWNTLGISLRRLKRYDEALHALSVCQTIDPKNKTHQINIGNIYNDQKDGPRGVELFTKLVRQQPSKAELQRNLGRSYWHVGDLENAERRLTLATKLKPDFVDAWLDLLGVVSESKSIESVIAIYESALAAMPENEKIREAKAAMLRREGRNKEAEAYLADLLWKFGDRGWIFFQLGGAISDIDRPRANIYYEKAAEMEPDNSTYQMAWAESLSRSRYGDESEHLEHAYSVLRSAFDIVDLNPSNLKIANEIFTRVADFKAADALGDFSTVGRAFAESGKHTALLSHLAHVRTPEDRLELVHQHQIWGDLMQSVAAKHPIKYSAPRPPNGKIRVGFMSSDLRAHPVAYFALPLFEHFDRERFEVYCYSYYQGNEDSLQKRIASMSNVFRWNKEISDKAAAQMISDDQLDILIELGGSTHMNKLNVMAWKPAPLQASWLGYPHSAGLKSIDHFILDPFVCPEQRDLVLEEPLLMPRSWIAMGELAFPERPITPNTPEDRNGFLTFGTANNPYKYSFEMVRTWARITASVPKSRFMLVRPESGAPSFRSNIAEIFAAEGVGADRLAFEDVRAHHMQLYNEIDISLDTFPQTGGTTTCEALFMGVPVVTLVGSAVFERLSYSILTNAGLGDLCAMSEEDFVKIALALAKDKGRRQKLRTELRGMLKASPLGQTKQFAGDFFDMLEVAVSRARERVKSMATG